MSVRDKVGRDVGELCGLDPIGIAATDDVEAFLAVAPDCVSYMPYRRASRRRGGSAGEPIDGLVVGPAEEHDMCHAVTVMQIGSSPSTAPSQCEDRLLGLVKSESVGSLSRSGQRVASRSTADR